jgi:hypothetical protein
MKIFLAYWCNEGFEYLGDITEYEHWEKRNLVEILSDRKPTANPIHRMISTVQLRATFNPQRNYELYVFSADNDCQLSDIKEWADTDPQSLVDWVRINGLCQYSDRQKEFTNRIK